MNSQNGHSVRYLAQRPARRRIAQLGRAALALTALVLMTSYGTALGAQPSSPLLWVGDAEVGDLSQFEVGSWNNVGGTRPRVVQDPVRDGQSAVELGLTGTTTARDGICCGSRNELLPRFRDLVPGDDLYFGFSTLLAPGFPTSDSWQVITQFKQNFDGSPPLSLNVEDGQFSIQGGSGSPSDPRPFVRPVGPAVTGQWSDWVLHVTFSPDPSVGFVEVWRDGELVLPRFSPPSGTMYPNPRGETGSYLKFGYYRDPTIATPGTIYFDDWRIGTTQEAVARPAAEPPVTEPPATEPPATEPPATEPPATEPPATEPPATEPPVDEPPAAEPPAAEPPATEPPVVKPHGRLRWVGDAESGDLSQFRVAPWNNRGGTVPRVVKHPVRGGRSAIELGLTGSTLSKGGICCGSRNELLPRFRDLVPGDDLYFGFSTLLAPGFPTSGGWQVITQFKQNFDGSPPLSLNVENDQFSIQGGYGHPSGHQHFMRPVGRAVTGQWSDWVMHVKFSPDPSVGFVEVWRDGELVLPRFSPASGTMYPNPRGAGSKLKIGPYRDSSIAAPGTIYFDDWRIGTTLDAIR